MEEILIVTISRELGSGGRTVGRKLAEALGIRYSDKELISKLRNKFQLSAVGIEKLKGEKKTWFSEFLQMVAPVPKEAARLEKDKPSIQEFRPDVTTDDVFKAETEILKAIASQGSCVIAGRSGFFALKDEPNKVDIFFTASYAHRLDRVMTKQLLSKEEAAEVIDEVDRRRENYVKRYTGTSRYDARNYDLVINMDDLSEDEAVNLILHYLKFRKK